MHQRSNRRVILSVVGVFFAVGLVAGLVLMVNAGHGFAGCTGAAEFGWLAPLFAASIIGGLAWVLLSQGPRTPDDSDPAPFAECPECGREVLGQWRMCPYCGEMLDSRYSTETATPKSE